MTTAARVYILSPAHCGGERARLILNDRATFDLAQRIRSPQGATIGEVFAFLSGLYFRGKLAYAQAFGKPPNPPQSVGARTERSGRCGGAISGAMVITTNRGLLCASTRLSIADLRAMASGDIDPEDETYSGPLRRDARALAAALGPSGRAVLLGSIASDKYVSILHEAFGERLLFPQEFVGRGDMSRGGLMLRCVDAGTPLTYVPVMGAVRRGSRPAKLTPRSRAKISSPTRTQLESAMKP